LCGGLWGVCWVCRSGGGRLNPSPRSPGLATPGLLSCYFFLLWRKRELPRDSGSFRAFFFLPDYLNFLFYLQLLPFDGVSLRTSPIVLELGLKQWPSHPTPFPSRSVPHHFKAENSFKYQGMEKKGFFVHRTVPPLFSIQAPFSSYFSIFITCPPEI